MCYTKFLRVLCASDTCLALTEAEVEMREHAVQSNPVSERSKAFDPNIIILILAEKNRIFFKNNISEHRMSRKTIHLLLDCNHRNGNCHKGMPHPLSI